MTEQEKSLSEIYDCAHNDEWLAGGDHKTSKIKALEAVASHVRAESAARIAELEAALTWRPIDENTPRSGAHIILAVTGGVNPDGEPVPPVIGEAYFGNDEWWWAGTGHSDYYSGPISELNYGSPTHWQPIPAFVFAGVRAAQKGGSQ